MYLCRGMSIYSKGLFCWCLGERSPHVSTKASPEIEEAAVTFLLQFSVPVENENVEDEGEDGGVDQQIQ